VGEHRGGRLGGRRRGAGRPRRVGGADERDRETLALDARVLARVGPQAGGIGVDPEDDLRLAGRDGGREAFAEPGRR